jgi:hypothetical protein
MFKRVMFVMCAYCSTHDVKHVEFLNIEEDIEGRDIMTYRCPTTQDVQRSIVRAGGEHYEYGDHYA